MTQYWLMKTEPTTYSIYDLEKQGVTPWEGVRNYQARNFMRDQMKLGDKVLFYHSNCNPPGIVGLATVSKESHPDYFALDKNSSYFDPKASKEKPIWYMVEVSYEKKFSQTYSLTDIRNNPDLKSMMVIKKGSRLSIQPVSKEEYETIIEENN